LSLQEHAEAVKGAQGVAVQWAQSRLPTLQGAAMKRLGLGELALNLQKHAEIAHGVQGVAVPCAPFGLDLFKRFPGCVRKPFGKTRRDPAIHICKAWSVFDEPEDIPSVTLHRGACIANIEVRETTPDINHAHLTKACLQIPRVS